ncbi:DUF6492 family protein [Egbenema bharatensis]|uniref:DUF6492 family protein n=1 Tax=Egbenema bharatensis TaxID=3463334 RepID=UPI003A8AF25B
MSQDFDFVIPLYRMRWNTRAVLEGITFHYSPRAIHIITPEPGVRSLKERLREWQIAPTDVHGEETFFQRSRLTKERICAELDLAGSLYTPGWFYQQLLKLGAAEGIDDLSAWYMVWDSDLLPVNTWELIRPNQETIQHTFALLQHNQWGNAQIVSTWERWIRSILKVEPLTDVKGTFIPHHMWFNQSHLETFKQQLKDYFQSEDDWTLLMMRSAVEFGTFSEYWSYSSWVAANAPEDVAFHPYDRYGATTERFFDDGTGLFSIGLRHYLNLEADAENFSPPYEKVMAFIQSEYGSELPSSLSFESSPRHLKKNEATMHIEERRSRWNPRYTGNVV